MSHISKVIICFLIVSALLVGCIPAETPFDAVMITETPIPLSSTAISQSQTPVITSTITTSTIDNRRAQDEILEGCIELSSQNLDNQIDGILLLQSQGNYSLLNLRNASESKLIEHIGRTYSPYVSPDMKHLIVEVCDDGCKYVLMNSNQLINTVSSQGDWVLWQWLDNKQVMILSLLEPHDVMILNPFTGDIETISLSLRGPYSISRAGNESLVPISLNPSRKRVLFYDENAGGRLVLWSVDDKRELASLPYNVDNAVGFSTWSPDSQRYVTVSPDSRTTTVNALFELNINGTISQLTHYDQEYEFSNVTSPVWSPDNQHIAFWLKLSTPTNSDPENLSQYLAIMDVFSLEIKTLCQTFSTPYYPAFPILWSSDGQQLIANTRTAEGVVEPIAIDIVRFTKTKIDTKGSWVEGWMITP